GCVLAVATSKSRRGLTRALDQTGWGHFFDASRCADETHSKPHPRMLLELLAELGQSPEHAVMIGDTEYDMAMAKAAGMARIGVSYGAHAAERFAPYAPELILQQMDELVGWHSERTNR